MKLRGMGLVICLVLLCVPRFTLAQAVDIDQDGLTNSEEINYHTDPSNPDTDGEGVADGDEIRIFGTDPLKPKTNDGPYTDADYVRGAYDITTRQLFNQDKLTEINKKIGQLGLHALTTATLDRRLEISLSKQTLTYYLSHYGFKTILISSGDKKHPTPVGTFTIDKKLDRVTYKGRDGNKSYYYPNTKWNLRFLPHRAGNYYIHGAYWHNSFGTPISHGCINVSYENMEPLYKWAVVGTKVIIK